VSLLHKIVIFDSHMDCRLTPCLDDGTLENIRILILP